MFTGEEEADIVKGDCHHGGLSNMQNLKAVTSGATAGISFYSADNGRTFAFYANPVGGAMSLTIDREGQSQYRATMQKQ